MNFRNEWNECLIIFENKLKDTEIITKFPKIKNFNLDSIILNDELLLIPPHREIEYSNILVSNILKDPLNHKEKINLLYKRFFGNDFDDGLSIIYFIITRKHGHEKLLKFVTKRLEPLVEKIYKWTKEN